MTESEFNRINRNVGIGSDAYGLGTYFYDNVLWIYPI